MEALTQGHERWISGFCYSGFSPIVKANYYLESRSFWDITQCSPVKINILEDKIIHKYRCQNLKSYIIITWQNNYAFIAGTDVLMQIWSHKHCLQAEIISLADPYTGMCSV
jgi:hypothetical protein